MTYIGSLFTNTILSEHVTEIHLPTAFSVIFTFYITSLVTKQLRFLSYLSYSLVVIMVIYLYIPNKATCISSYHMYIVFIVNKHGGIFVFSADAVVNQITKYCQVGQVTLCVLLMLPVLDWL